MDTRKKTQKLTGIKSEKNHLPVHTDVSDITDSGEILAGYSQESSTYVAGIWVGKERFFVPMQKLFEFNPSLIPKDVLLTSVFLMSPSCKSMIIKAVDKSKEKYQDIWLSYVLPNDDDSNLNNNILTLSIN